MTFFHKKAKVWFAWNNVKEISQEYGTKIWEFLELKKVAWSHFGNLFTEQRKIEPNEIAIMLENIHLIITKEDNFELIKPIEEEEMLKEIWDLEPNKSFGLDEFSISFYITY